MFCWNFDQTSDVTLNHDKTMAKGGGPGPRLQQRCIPWLNQPPVFSIVCKQIKGTTYRCIFRYIHPDSAIREGSACMWICMCMFTSFGDSHYRNWNYAFVIQQKSRARWQVSAPSAWGCIWANDFSFKVCVI